MPTPEEVLYRVHERALKLGHKIVETHKMVHDKYNSGDTCHCDTLIHCHMMEKETVTSDKTEEKRHKHKTLTSTYPMM